MTIDKTRRNNPRKKLRVRPLSDLIKKNRESKIPLTGIIRMKARIILMFIDCIAGGKTKPVLNLSTGFWLCYFFPNVIPAVIVNPEKSLSDT